MSFEDEIKQAFDRHSDDVSPRPDAWSGVERGVRRAHARRLAALSSATAAIVALAVAIPLALMSRDADPGGFTNPNATESPQDSTPSPTLVDTTGWKPRVAPNDGFSLKIPPDWRGGVFEGVWEFHPKNLPGPQQSGETYFVAVAPDNGILSYPCGSGVGRCSEKAPKGEQNDWLRMQLDPIGTKVIVHIVGAEPDLVSIHYRNTEGILSTLAGYDGSVPVHGSFAAAIDDDSARRAVVRYLDTTIERLDRSEFFSASADANDQRDPCEWYVEEGSARPCEKWVISARRDDGDRATFEGLIYFTDSQGQEATVGISLTLERSGGRWLISDQTATN